MDSKNLYDICQDDTSCSWFVSPIIEEIQDTKASFPSWRWLLVPREANVVADWMAKSSRQRQVPSNWLCRPPRDLVGVLSRDGLPSMSTTNRLASFN